LRIFSISLSRGFDNMANKRLFATLLCSSLLAGQIASAADLIIVIEGVKNSSGHILAAIYGDESTFLDTTNAKTLLRENAASTVRLVAHDLPAGSYAVSAIHDENDNGKLDRNFMNIPTEGFGFSNDALGNAGPPKFEQARFDFDGKKDKTIKFSFIY